MALLVLASEWKARTTAPLPPLSVASVDHGLRSQSAAECMFVAKEAARLGLPHATLGWQGKKPATGIPEAARNVRYALLEAHARSFSCNDVAVATAHQRDDQAETFAMRLARGAGVDGLAAMPAERPLREGSQATLVRPLLSFPRSRLRATLEARGIAFVDDPTNEDVRYERTRVRSGLATIESAGISLDAIAKSAHRLGDAKAALRYAEDAFTATLDLKFGNEVFATLDRHRFDSGPAYLRQRVLARLIARYGGASPAPRLSEIETLSKRLQSGERTAATLGGVSVSAGSRFIRLWREAGRMDQAEISLSPGESRVWDGRFIVARSSAAGESVTVRPLGPATYTELAELLAPEANIPARAAHALPAFWTGGTLLAVPSLAPFARRRAAPFETLGCELRTLAEVDKTR